MYEFEKSSYAHECQIALEAVEKACRLAQRMQGTLQALDIVNKEDLSPVTITDFSCQALINHRILEDFPDALIMGEEDALLLRSPENHLIKEKIVDQLKEFDPSFDETHILSAIERGNYGGSSSARFWVLDPIDGTRGFIRNEQYAVALALIENGEVVLGILGCPRLDLPDGMGALMWAIKGEGAFIRPLDGKKISPVHISKDLYLRNLIFCEPKVTSSHHHAAAAEIATLLHADPQSFRLDSQCKYAVVALGQAAVYLRVPFSFQHKEKIWDHAPGALIVEEAGGKVTDLKGSPLDFTQGKCLENNVGLLVTNGTLHDKAVRACAKVLAF